MRFELLRPFAELDVDSSLRVALRLRAFHRLLNRQGLFALFHGYFIDGNKMRTEEVVIGPCVEQSL